MGVLGRRSDPPSSVGGVFEIIRTGTGQTRGAIARRTGLAPSTVSQRVEALISDGLVEEHGHDDSSGGRQARLLRVNGAAGAVAAATIGTHHLTLVVADLVGTALSKADIPIDVADGPQVVIDRIWQEVRGAFEALHLDLDLLRGLTLGVPAPVESRIGTVSSSAQLPGWYQANLRRLMTAHTSVPLLIENDANLLAAAEFALADPGVEDLLAVKVGSRIGSGIVSGGRLHRGASGAGGEISHTPTGGVSVIQCWCGTQNCLESVASGAATVAQLQRDGHDVRSTFDLVERSRDGDPRTIALLRDSGLLVGEVLAGVVNFINPRTVVFGGSLSAAGPFVAAVRGVLFQRCLPVVTEVLDVHEGTAGPDGEAWGGVQLILEEVLTAEAVDRAVALKRSPQA